MYSKSKKSKRRQILQLDYDDESSRSTPSPSTVQSNGRHASPTPTPVAVIKLPPTQPPTQPPTVMDDEFANFMAEIDAMDDDGTPEHPNNEDTPEPPPPPPPAPVEEVEETFDMQEPVCKWQQCLDENTSCYYYWHMDNNDVSWDIPTEFTQHLLRHREYEEALAAFNASKAARDARKALVQAPPPPPPPPSADGDGVSETEVEPSTEQGRNFLWFMRDHEREEKAKQEENKRAYAQKFVKGKTLDEERKEIPSVEDPKRDDDREEILKRLSGHSVAMLQGKGRSKFLQRIGAYDQEPDSRSQSPTIARETVAKAASEVVKETTEDEEDEEEDEMALLLELQQKQEELIALEMEVCSPSSMTPEPPPPEPQAETPAPPPPPPPPPDDDEPPLPPEPDLEPPSKKAKVEEKTKTDGAEETPTGDQTKRENFVPKEGSLALTKDQSEIEDLSSVLVNKLECMQITRESLTKMQILLVEIQTRIVDWVAGALSTSHLLTKLRDAEKQITDYETIATPPGWTCHYDRDCKQYYYMNDESGELQWDYPITKADLPLDFGAKETTNESEPRNGAVPPPPKPRTPSPPPPPVQAPPPPVQAPPPPAMAPPPPPPPGIVSKAIPDMPPPPPPPGLEPSSSENIDMEIDEEGEVTVPELLPPPVPAALRPKAQPPQYYAPMGHYYPRPRPYAPMGPYSYPMDPNYYGAPAPAPPPSAPEPPPRPAHVSAGPVLFSAKENKMEKAPSPPLPPETKPSAPEPPKPPTPDSVVAAPAPPSPASESVPISGRKRKKKDKLKVNDSLSLKKKNVSGLVMKWQQAQQQVTQEVSKRGPDDT